MPAQFKTYIIDPILLFLSLFVGCSVIGWATLIWQGKTISTRRKVAGAFLSGALGLGVGFWLWKDMSGTDLGKLVAISMLSGAGGAALVDLLLAVLFKRVRRYGNLDEKEETP